MRGADYGSSLFVYFEREGEEGVCHFEGRSGVGGFRGKIVERNSEKFDLKC
jgi:hypothetical protein